jgi:CheY-like chemotaxis protein
MRELSARRMRTRCKRDLTANHHCRVRLREKLPKGGSSSALALFVLNQPTMRNTTKKILIVDSNDAFRASLGGFIKGLGHDVFEGTSGPEAIEKASTINPDLIMMDVRLPGMNGDEVTARLKSNRLTRNIPVVINTGWTTACNIEERVDRALNAGAAEILYKPLQFPMLRDVLRIYLAN